MKSKYTIAGVKVKRPSNFKIERYNVTTMERLANGEMVGDLVAKKRKFYFTYDAISATDLNKILDAIWESSGIFFKLEYVENNTVKTATVYVGSIPSTLYRTGGEWVWKDVTFNLIEK